MSVARGARRFVLWWGGDVNFVGVMCVVWFFVAGFSPLFMWIGGIHAGFGGDQTYARFMWHDHKLWEHDYTVVNRLKGTPWPIIYGLCGFLIGGYAIAFGTYWYQRGLYVYHGQHEHWKRMVKRYGRRVGRDDHGTLWRIPALADEDPINVVEVKDATEVNGKYQRYWLHVPFAISTQVVNTPKKAVAWTFGFTRVDQYDPMVQT